MGWLIAGIVAVVLLVVIWFVVTYNGLVRARNGFKTAFAQIDAQLTRRHDLIPNLVETAKGYLAHERETLDAVVRARAAAVTAQSGVGGGADVATLAALAGAENTLTQALGRFFGLAEAYPNLKANQNMLALQEELTTTENRIAFARQAFNDSVMVYNIKRQVFPTNLVAGMFSFAPAGCSRSTTPRNATPRRFRSEPPPLHPPRPAVNFFERQREVRRVSTRLVFLFAAAVIGIVVSVNVVLLIALNLSNTPPQHIATVIVATTVVTLIAIGLAALFRTIALRGGGGVVARAAGGVLVPTDTQDPQLRRLRNVVEEIAIASGVTVPEIYILPQEKGINAFAAGWTPADAAVAVTRGSLERLNRAELQGVIGHEFSHVVNGDMRLNIKLMGLLFGILFLAVIGRGFTQAGFLSGGGRDDNRDSNALPLVLFGIALVGVGFIGVAAGRLIQSAVSRQREYLADASAVQYTRQTSGIVGALAKIAGLEEGSTLRTPKRDEVGHMLFGSGTSLTSLFATHPPLTDRIRVLDPSFDQAKLEQLARQWAAAPAVRDGGGRAARVRTERVRPARAAVEGAAARGIRRRRHRQPLRRRLRPGRGVDQPDPRGTTRQGPLAGRRAPRRGRPDHGRGSAGAGRPARDRGAPVR